MQTDLSISTKMNDKNSGLFVTKEIHLNIVGGSVTGHCRNQSKVCKKKSRNRTSI